jgi:tetraacyldisaccharide 4'-kinase
LLKQNVNVIISDDGLQHYRLPRNIGICVVDGSRGFGNGHLIPAGPLREPLSRLKRFDSVIVNGEMDRIPEHLLPADLLSVRHMTLEAGLLRSMSDGQSWRLGQFAGCKANAVAGIGNPERFFDLLRGARIKVIEHVFPDHHNFDAADFVQMDKSLPILMTEKDAVKCKNLGLKNSWYLSVDAILPAEWERDLVEQVVQGRAGVGRS